MTAGAAKCFLDNTFEGFSTKPKVMTYWFLKLSKPLRNPFQPNQRIFYFTFGTGLKIFSIQINI